MGFIELADVTYALPGGWTLFEGVSFKVPDGEHAALVGANGIGKTTLLRMLAGEERPVSGSVRTEGRVSLMRQFIGSQDRPTTIRAFLLAAGEPALREAAATVDRAEARLSTETGDEAQLAYADALHGWEQAGGYAAEVVWDRCAHRAFGGGYPESAERAIETLSGGERKRLALEVIFASSADVLLLDEPDNTLDIDGKTWLEDMIRAEPRTIVFVSHDRTVLDRAAARIVTLEGRAAWTHVGGFSTYAEARDARIDRLDERHRRFEEKRAQLEAHMKDMKRRAAYNDGLASRAQAAETRLRRFEREEPPERAATQDVRMHIDGGRTGRVAFRARGLGIAGIVEPFDAEVVFGERIGVIGPNGTGKSHFLRLLAGEGIAHDGAWLLGARVQPALFAQLHERPDVGDLGLLDLLLKRGLDRTKAMSALRRYELDHVARNPFELLSGGQQARFQIMLMEIDSPTMLLLDEPTDNLDVASADALEGALLRYEGTVIAATHDRWFMRLMDRFLSFDDGGHVRELLASPYDVTVR